LQSEVFEAWVSRCHKYLIELGHEIEIANLTVIATVRMTDDLRTTDTELDTEANLTTAAVGAVPFDVCPGDVGISS
jgi:hypothetical protein